MRSEFLSNISKKINQRLRENQETREKSSCNEKSLRSKSKEILTGLKLNHEQRQEVNPKKKREGKVLKVFSSGRWVPRNQG